MIGDCFGAIPSPTVVLNVCPGGRGQIKQKKKTVPQKVTIAKIPRAKKKYVTRVCGLGTFGKTKHFIFANDYKISV